MAALTGLLFYLSFPGADIWPLAFIAWVPWIIALRGQSVRMATLQGMAAGLVMGLLGFYWLLGMLREFSGFPVALCAVFMVLLCAYQGGRYALLGALYAWGTRRGWPRAPVFFAAFIATETAYPLLFPFTFGATLHAVYPLVQVADLGGPIAVALVAIAPNWALGHLLTRYLEEPNAPFTKRMARALAGAGGRKLLFLLAVPALASIYGVIRIRQVDAAVAAAEKIRVGIVQANMGLKEKREDRTEGLRRHIKLTRKLVRDENIDLVVWPETSVTGAIEEDIAFRYYKQHVTRRLGVPAIVGAVILRRVEDERNYVLFNTALISNDEGTIVGRYDKQFLLAFGEYLPFGETFPQLYQYSPNSGRFSPGTSFEPVKFGEHEIAVFICYEDIVPSFVNKLMHHGDPGLLVNMTNDAWFGDTSEPWEHMALAKMRAVEQRRFFIRSTNSGISGVVDPVGRLLQRTPTFEKAVVAEDVAWLYLGSLYRLWGNTPWWIITAVSVIMALVGRPERWKRTKKPPEDQTRGG